jgi:phosphoserine phosphatase RsbU/P
MEMRLDIRTREQLVDRRQRLVAVRQTPADTAELGELLAQVDAALSRFDAGTYGLCETCHDPIEPDRLRVDPLIRFCLDHLDLAEQRSLERDLQLASQVQQALLPKRDIATSHWDIHYRYDAMGPVSGDYCDVILPRDADSGVLVAVGDVSGKGVAASLLSSHLSALFRTLDDVGLSLRDMLQRANRLFCESTGESHYATLALGRAGADGTIEWANAAQGAPLHFHDGRVEALPARGLPLGMFCDSPYRAERLKTSPGDFVVFYTDGVTEARNPRDEEFGLERLASALDGTRPASARDAANLCFAALDRFRSGARANDDVTLLVLRRSAGSPG